MRSIIIGASEEEEGEEKEKEGIHLRMTEYRGDIHIVYDKFFICTNAIRAE